MNPPSHLSAGLHRLALEQMQEAVVIVDREGRVIFWNAAATRLFGFDEAEAMGRGLEAIVPERMWAAHDAGFRRALASGELKVGGRVMTTRANSKSGGKLYVDFSFALVRGPDGETLAVMAVGRDATERYLREAAARAQNGSPT
jgi:PAS domain S-box-containing protein